MLISINILCLGTPHIGTHINCSSHRRCMVEIQPLPGLRYTEKVPIEDVTTPPYDVISPVEQEAFYNKSPYNVIRLILGKTKESDTESSNRYTRAKAFLAEWQGQGILQRDAPSFYLYEQVFSLGGILKSMWG